MPIAPVLLDRVRVGDIDSAAPGVLLGVPRADAMLVGVAVGQADATSHILVNETDGRLVLYATARMRAPHVLHIKGEFILEMGSDEIEVRGLQSYVGCLGLSSAGLVVCASMGVNNFREDIPAYVRLDTWQQTDPTVNLLHESTWRTSWSLSVRDASDRMVRVVGNNSWPEGARLRR